MRVSLIHIPGLGPEGSPWLGPICRTWKTFRTSSHPLKPPSSDPRQPTARKTQHIQKTLILKTKQKQLTRVINPQKRCLLEAGVRRSPGAQSGSGASRSLEILLRPVKSFKSFSWFELSDVFASVWKLHVDLTLLGRKERRYRRNTWTPGRQRPLLDSRRIAVWITGQVEGKLL